MSREPSEDAAYLRAVAAYRAAVSRDPRHFPWGCLAGDSSAAALGPFLWFATPADLLAGLACIEVDLLCFDEDEAERIRRAVEQVCAATRDPGRIDLRALCMAFEGWTEIVWLGRFADLCERGGELATGLRRAFREACKLGEHAGPIAEEECDAFVAYLQRLASEALE